MSQNALQKRPHFIPALIAVVMLLGTLAKWPYGYYQLLRFVVCGVAIYIAFTAFTWQKIWAVWMFGFVALLFNPFIPIHLSKELWQVLDFICVILFIVSLFVVRLPTNNKLHKSS